MIWPLEGKPHSRTGPTTKSHWTTQNKTDEENNRRNSKLWVLGGENGEDLYGGVGVNMLKMDCINFSKINKLLFQNILLQKFLSQK